MHISRRPKAKKIATTAHARQGWTVTVPNDTTVEEILKPSFWVHYASNIHPGAKIEVVSEDYLLDMELRVTRKKDGLVFVNALRITEDKKARAPMLAESGSEQGQDAVKADVPEGYKVGFAPGNETYYVVLKATGEKLYTGIRSQGEAAAKAQEHAKLAEAA